MYNKDKKKIKKWLKATKKYLNKTFGNVKSLEFDENNQPNHCHIELITTANSVCWFNSVVGENGWVFYENRKEYLSEMMDFLWKIKPIEGERV